MEVRTFGRTSLRISEIGLGCARIGGIFQTDPGEFVELLCAALDSGINFFDTADMYSQGESEALLGRAFRKRRHEVVIASKAGYCLPSQRRLAARLKPLLRPAIKLLGIKRERLPAAVRGTLSQDFSPAYLRRAVEGSLRRLRTDWLDLFQLHSPPAEVVERGEWVPALEALKREGKIRYYGVSCDTVEAAVAALRHPGVSSLQIAINLLEREAADRILPLARGKVAVIARECLANGLLVKEPGSIDLANYCRTATERELRQKQLVALRKLAAENGCTLPQLALQFVRRLEGVSVTLVGMRTKKHFADTLRQLDAPALPAAALASRG
jgi:aryl-alcohol dehydrogenase-like predicted oxidoreductase